MVSPIYGRGAMVSAAFACVCIAMFGFGVGMGGSVAHNESASLADTHHEITDVKHEIAADFRTNLTGYKETAVMSVYRPIEYVGFSVTHFGVDIGYRYPNLAKPIMYASQGAMYLIIGLAIGKRILSIKRATQ